MQIKNALIYGSDCRFKPGTLSWEGERLTADSQSGEVLDAGGCYLIPGLVDLHFHGCMSHDFCEGTPEATRAIAKYEARNGVTSICPATMTLPMETLLKVAENAAAFAAEGEEGSARLVGLHLEGPFLSEKKKGAQNGAYLHTPDVRMFRELNRASNGLCKIISVAPELPGSEEFIRETRDEVVLSLGHSSATYEEARAAIQNGMHHITHFYNAMTPFTHRAPGVVGAVWESSEAKAELICDGVHLHPTVVRLTFRFLGDDRIIFISDSMEATGMSDGSYQLGGQQVNVKGKFATLSDGTLAGSATNLFGCLRTAVLEMGIPLESAVKCATRNPAKEIGIFEDCGSLEVGKRADFLLLEPETLDLRAVYIGGKKVDC